MQVAKDSCGVWSPQHIPRTSYTARSWKQLWQLFTTAQYHSQLCTAFWKSAVASSYHSIALQPALEHPPETSCGPQSQQHSATASCTARS